MNSTKQKQQKKEIDESYNNLMGFAPEPQKQPCKKEILDALSMKIESSFADRDKVNIDHEASVKARLDYLKQEQE